MPERIAIIGAGPLPIYEGQSSMGPGIRTWQLAKPLIRQGCDVLLVTFEFALGEGWDFEPDYMGGHGGVGAGDMLVPLVLAGPGIEGGSKLETARTVDVVPTLVELLGGDMRAVAFDGKSLVKEIKDK